MKNFLLILLLIITSCLYAQNLGTSFSSDDLSDENTNGALAYSYPIFTIQDGNIAYPVSINYTSGNGVRVNQSASEVGLGWDLSSSFITRQIQGGRDFLDLGFRSEEEYIKVKKVGYYKKEAENILINEPAKLLNVDGFPDLYNLYSSIYSTTFVAKKTNEIYDLNANKTTITGSVFEQKFNYSEGFDVFTEYTRKDHFTKDFGSFEIKTDKGFILSYNDYNISNQYSDSYRIPSGWNTPNNNEYIPEVSKWNISRIKDLNTNREIIFEYESYSPDFFKKESDNISEKQLKDLAITANHRFIIENSPSKSSERVDPERGGPYPTFSEDPNFTIENKGGFLQMRNLVRDLIKKRLKKISFSSGEIVFDYNLNRKDEYNEKALTDITIKNFQGKIVKRIKLNYGYFNEGIGNEFASSRLKLISIQELNLDNTIKSTTAFTYNESNVFPYKNSIAYDFAGYFNNSFSFPSNDSDNNNDHPNYIFLNSKPKPILYYHPNLYQYSLLPFALENKDSYVIPGNLSRESNLTHSKIYSLKEITLPTGGKLQYDYELNEFNLFNQNIKGGGVRLLSKTLKDSSGTKILKKINYRYLLENENSSGVLIAAPYFGHPTTPFFEMSLKQDGTFYSNSYNGFPNWNQDKLYEKFVTRSFAIPGYSQNGYDFIIYSRIEKNEDGNGKVIQEFEANKVDMLDGRTVRCHGIKFYKAFINDDRNTSIFSCNGLLGEFFIANSNFARYITNDSRYNRGNIINQKIYDNNNQLIIEKDYKYKHFTSSLFWISNTDLRTINFWTKEPHHYAFEVLLSNYKNYQKEYKKVAKITTTTYDRLNNQSMTQVEGFTYNNYGYPTTKSSSTNENGYLQYIGYPMDYSNPILQKLDKINPNLAVWSQLDNDSKGFTISGNVINFREENNFIVPSESIKESNQLIDKTLYNKYDEYGNVLEIQKENNIPTSFIWGYRKNSIIVEIVGVKYNDIPHNIITSLQSQSDNGTLNSSSFNSLFTSFPDALITCYVYDPLLGIKEKIGANGFKEVYEYDSNTFELINIKNHKGEIIKNYKTNIKNR